MSEERTATHVRCVPCGHRWVGLYLPMNIQDAARALGNLTCPMCAAGADKIRLDEPPTRKCDER